MAFSDPSDPLLADPIKYLKSTFKGGRRQLGVATGENSPATHLKSKDHGDLNHLKPSTIDNSIKGPLSNHDSPLAPEEREQESKNVRVYTLPKAVCFIARPLDVAGVSTPNRIKKLSEFVRLIDSAGSPFWIGLSTYQSVYSLSSNDNSDLLWGGRAYQVTVGQSVKQDDATSRVEVTPTGRIIGEVVGAYEDNLTVLVEMYDWFTGSDIFEMGSWTDVVNERVQAGDDGGYRERTETRGAGTVSG